MQNLPRNGGVVRLQQDLERNRCLRRWLAILAAICTCWAMNNGFCAEAADPILDLLLKKGLITEGEAQKVQAEVEAIRTNQAAPPLPESKWKISTGIKSVELFGDIRARFEQRTAEDPDHGRIDLNRARYAVRVGLRGEVFDDFYYGFRLETAANPRSPWVTFGTSSSGVPYQGPFGKSTAGFDIGQAYIGWRPADGVDITVGKMPNPLYTTPMVWDNDLNPEGVAEHFKYSVGEADFFANFGQFIYQDTNPTKTSPGYFNLGYDSSVPPFLLAWQAGINYHLTKTISLKVAPVLYNYTGHGVNTTAPGSVVAPDFTGTFVGQGATNNLAGNNTGAWSGYPQGYYDGFIANQTGIRDLLVLEVPAELNFKMEKINVRLFGDYAQNLKGAERAQAAYAAAISAFTPSDAPGGGIAPIPAAQIHDNKAYQIGIGVGSAGPLYGPMQGFGLRHHLPETRLGDQDLLATCRAVRSGPQPCGLGLFRGPGEFRGHIRGSGLQLHRQHDRNGSLRPRPAHQRQARHRRQQPGHPSNESDRVL